MISNSESKGAQILKKIDEFNASDRIDLKLLENSHHYLNGEINETSVGECIKWLIYESLNSDKQKILTLYVNSTGGDLYEAFGLIDIMQASPHIVRCIGIGAVMSAAFLIFASGTKGERYAAKNTSFMCHQFTESMDNKYHDLKATMKENDQCNERMIDILKTATGLAPSVIKKRLLPASDVYLTAEETVDVGVADHILA
jgi:ATP-dependent Clp protease protease subunit